MRSGERVFCPLCILAPCLAFTPAARGGPFRAQASIGESIAPSTAVDHGTSDVEFPLIAGVGRNFDQVSDGVSVPSIHAQADSLADGFGLHAHAFVQLIRNFSSPTPQPEQTFYSVANAFANYEVTLHGPPGNITTSFNFHLSGSQAVGTSYSPGTPDDPRASSMIQINYATPAYNLSFAGQHQFSVRDGFNDPVFENGALIGFDGNDVITTDLFTVPANTPFLLKVTLSAISSFTSMMHEGATAQANTNFSGTLTFATDRPVFNLPAGYTASSADANIIDNTFTLPVPEPATLGLLLPALTIALSRRR